MMLNLPCRVANFEPGTYLVRQGDIATSTCLVLSGFVCRTKISGSGSRQILSIHLKGDLIDLQNSYLAEADCNAQALTHVEVALIPSQAIIDLVEIRPKIRHALWLDILTDASISRQWILNIGQHNALARVAHLICEMAFRQDPEGMLKGMIYEWPMTQEQLGDATGLTAVHINRMLKTLRNDAIVSVTNRTFIINDWHKLRSVADFTQGYLYQRNLLPFA